MIDPKIALVICTRNRASRLNPFFESLSKLRCDWPWDLIIVNNGSTDDTSERLKNFAKGFSGRIILATEMKAGLGRARNCGWRATKAEIIAFTDDDCYPDANFLNDVLAVYSDLTVGFSGGRILLHDASDAPITIYERSTEQFYSANGFIPGGVIQGASMAFRREALVDINGFDDNLGAGTLFAFEDVDAEARALAAGWNGKYDPRSVIYHHHGRKPGAEVDALVRQYETGRGAYYGKCILFLPQRWQCLRYWLRNMKQQSISQSWREARAALNYFFHQIKMKANTTY